MKTMINKLKNSSPVDVIGLIVSGLCLVHCWIMPVLLLILPGFIYMETLMHPLLGGLALLSSIIIIAIQKTKLMIWGSLILSNALILTPLFFAHDCILHALERTFNTAGSVLLIFTHYYNVRQCQKTHCN